MSTGLAQIPGIGRYARAAHALVNTWAGLNKVQRATTLINAACAELTRFGVANPNLTWDDMDDNGQFRFRTWEVVLSNAVWNTNPATENQRKMHISGLADTVYHECRHCEQWFRIARLLATQKKNLFSYKYHKTDVVTMTGIPLRIVRLAREARSLSAGEKNEGQAWYEAIYGQSQAPTVAKGQEAPVQVLSNGINRRDLVLGAAYLKKTQGLSVDLQSISDDRQMTQYLQYRNLLPEEEDAHSVGTAVQTMYYQLAGLVGAPVVPKHANARPSASANVSQI
jgi:hypothetical protein